MHLITFLGLSIECEPTVRKTVAENPNTPLELLLDLARDPEPLVRAAVAANPNLLADEDQQADA